MDDPASSNQPGEGIRGYNLRDPLGQGGFGVVYRAYQPAVDREVAIKVILPQYANLPAFIRRFDSEARLVARLEHPNIVPLYDYWRDPSGAYLVMRYLRGGSLRGRLAGGRLPPAQMLHLLEEITSALQLAHQRGIIHRDIKPDNILLDEQGHAYLTDFGVAKLLGAGRPAGESEADDSISGSLEYIAPEQVTNHNLVDARTDIYSLALVVYEMLAGMHPYQGEDISTRFIRQVTQPLPSLAAVVPELPPDVDGVLQQAASKRLEERYESVSVFLEELRFSLASTTGPGYSPDGVLTTSASAAPATSSDPTTKTIQRPRPVYNPYKGLRAFEEFDAQDFFGRQALVENLLARLACEPAPSAPAGAGRFLAVIGPSGSGKSSVIKAGLLPRLRGEPVRGELVRGELVRGELVRPGALPGSEHWLIAEMLPGAHPLQTLALKLLEFASQPIQDLPALLAASPYGLMQCLDRVLPEAAPSGAELLLVIDQFEEVFTRVTSEAERAFFLDSLQAALAAPGARLRLVITLRADFYDRPLRYPRFGALVQASTEVVLPLLLPELEQVIRLPAEGVGVALEPGLAAEIAAEVSEQPGALPLLQYALTEIFEQRQDQVITRSAYHKLGGVLGAMTCRAEEIYLDLDAEGKAAARLLFSRLVTLGEGAEDTRRRAFRPELDSLSPQVSQLIEIYGRARLLSFDRDPQTRTPTVEVAHEALIRSWPTLRRWLNENRDALRVQSHLTYSVQEWQRQKRDDGELYRGARLAQALEWAAAHPSELTPAEREFLDLARVAQAAEEAEREAQRQREMQAMQKLAAAERQRAEETAQAADKLRHRGRMLAVALGMAVLLVVISVWLGWEANQQRSAAVQNFRHSEQLRLAAEGSTQLLSNANIEAAPLLSIQSLLLGYSPQADMTLQRAMTLPYPLVKLKGEPGDVFRALYTPDGRGIVTAGPGQVGHLWDAASGQEIRRFSGHDGGLMSLAISPHGDLIAGSNSQFTIFVWDVNTGELLHTLRGHTEDIWSVAFSPDGARLVSVSYDMTLRVWDIARGQEIHQWALPTTSSCAVFSPDGRYLLVTTDDNFARLWDAETGVEIRQFSGHILPVVIGAFSPDGQYVLTGSNDKTARLWSVATGHLLLTLEGHQDAVYGVVFSPDGQYLLTASVDRSAILWDRTSGAVMRRFIGQGGRVYSAEFSPDGAYIVTAATDDSAWVWPSGLEPQPQRLAHTTPVTTLALSPDGSRVLTVEASGQGWLWDAATGERLKALRGHTYEVEGSDFSPDGRWAATASADYSVRLWDTRTGEEVRQFRVPDRDLQYWGARFSPDGRRLLVAADYATLVWDIASSELVWRNDALDSIYAAAFSADGRYIAAGGADHTLFLFDAADGKLVWSAEVDTAIYNLDYAPDGSSIVIGGARLLLVDAATGKTLKAFEGHAAEVNSVAFSTNGQQILSGSADGTARLWDVATGAELRTFAGQQGVINSVAFAPDGTRLYIGSSDHTAMRWEMDYHALIQQACDLLQRDLTDAERVQFNLENGLPTCWPP